MLLLLAYGTLHCIIPSFNSVNVTMSKWTKGTHHADRCSLRKTLRHVRSSVGRVTDGLNWMNPRIVTGGWVLDRSRHRSYCSSPHPHSRYTCGNNMNTERLHNLLKWKFKAYTCHSDMYQVSIRYLYYIPWFGLCCIPGTCPTGRDTVKGHTLYMHVCMQ